MTRSKRITRQTGATKEPSAAAASNASTNHSKNNDTPTENNQTRKKKQQTIQQWTTGGATKVKSTNAAGAGQWRSNGELLAGFLCMLHVLSFEAF